MRYTAKQVGDEIKKVRKSMHVTQHDLALTAGTGMRFIIDLEKGKPTCEFGKVLAVLNTLGIDMILTPPAKARVNLDVVASEVAPQEFD